MSLSNKKRSQLTEEVVSLQNREEKHKQFIVRLFLADGIQQKKGELSPLRFTGIGVSFSEAITTQLYPNTILRILLNSPGTPKADYLGDKTNLKMERGFNPWGKE